MIPAWSLLVTLAVGAAGGWFVHSWLGRRPAPAPPPPIVEASVGPPAEPEQKMEAVLTELERRYQGRKADPEPSAPRPARRRPRKS